MQCDFANVGSFIDYMGEGSMSQRRRTKTFGFKVSKEADRISQVYRKTPSLRRSVSPETPQVVPSRVTLGLTSVQEGLEADLTLLLHHLRQP